MTKIEARLRLKAAGAGAAIKDVYDLKHYEETFSVLLPTFEYPDWDWRTIGEFLKHTA